MRETESDSKDIYHSAVKSIKSQPKLKFVFT